MAYRIEESTPLPEELLALYESVGWLAYTKEPDTLIAAVYASHSVFCARAVPHGELLGLARTVSDGYTVAYLQDILVRRDYQRMGVGASLLGSVLKRYSNVRQFILITDNEEAQRRFYESCGLIEVHDIQHHPLRSFVRA